MGQLCAVSFNRYGRLYYFDPGDHRPQVGDRVLVATSSGPEVAECVWAPQWTSEDTSGFPQLAGLATDGDLARDAEIRRRKAEAKVAAKKLIREHDLPMKVVAVDHVPASVLAADDAAGHPASQSAGPSANQPADQPGERRIGEYRAPDQGPRTTIYFTAPHRVDFRSLVRDLGATLRCRVELRQLSARDSARIQGGIGSCGRDLCCATFLTDFEPVTIRMAKDQDLPLNPLRISGACGRLMCCLKYEHPLYQKFHATAPAVGQRVTTDEGASGKVVGHNVPRDTVVVRMDEDGSRGVCSRASVCGSRQAFEGRYSD